MDTPQHAPVPGNEGNRRFPRHRLDARIQVAVFRGGTTQTFWGRTNEVGQDGVGATVSSALIVGEVVTVEFPIPTPPYAIKVRAIVRYCQGLRAGFEFLVVSEDQRHALRRACEMFAAGL